jgi:hypothetical protein
MKILASYLFIFLFVFAGQISFAQNSIFMGKIVDENNKPVPGAKVQVSKAGYIIAEVSADNDGLYYTQLLPSGYYKVDIIADDKLVKAKRVFLKEQDKIRWYYNMKLAGDKAEVIVTADNPFMEHRLSLVEERELFYDSERRTLSFRIDSSGEVIDRTESFGIMPMQHMK